MYRSVFADFSDSFVTYKPLLNAIQREYERTIESLKVFTLITVHFLSMYSLVTCAQISSEKVRGMKQDYALLDHEHNRFIAGLRDEFTAQVAKEKVRSSLTMMCINILTLYRW